MDRARRPADHTTSSDLASSVAARLAGTGMSRDQLARRAGMSPRYLDQILAAGPAFDLEGLHRIADALGVPYRELSEGREDPPPGQATAAPHPVLARLTERECWDRLGDHGVGRIALSADPGPPLVMPVNYSVDARTILYRTDPEGAAAPDAGAAVTFEIDRVDEESSSGWSVLVTGTAERSDDDPAVAGPPPGDAVRPAEPWAGGNRPLWVRIRPEHVTGRHITTM